MAVNRSKDDRPTPGVVNGRPPMATPPAGGSPPINGAGGGLTPQPSRGGTIGGGIAGQTNGGNGSGNPFGQNPTPGSTRGGLILGGGAGRSAGSGASAAMTVGQQTAQNNVSGATPFMQTPGMQIASQRVSGADVQNDPAISAQLQDFYNRTAPGIQHSAELRGLGRSTAAQNAMSQAQESQLAPLYEQAFGREQTRLGNMNTAAENELGRQERSSGRVADANQNMAQLLMQMSNQRYNQQQGAGQNIMGAGGQFRDISQQGNTAAYNDFLRRQALGEQAVYAPFGGLAQGGLGSTTSQTGK